MISSFGDINTDGTLAVNDAVLLARIISEDQTTPVTELGMRNSDIDESDIIDLCDLTYLFHQLLYAT